MFKDMKIGRRLALALWLLVFLVVGMAGAGFWGVKNASDAMLDILRNDLRLAKGFAGVQLISLHLQNTEQRLFLNVADRDQAEKIGEEWKKSRKQLGGALELVSKDARQSEDIAAIRDLRNLVNDYETEFLGLLRQIANGQVTTPRGAMEAMQTKTMLPNSANSMVLAKYITAGSATAFGLSRERKSPLVSTSGTNTPRANTADCRLA